MVTATILQFRIIRQDQEVRWIKATCKKRFDKNGQLIILMGVLNDITETQLRAEMMEILQTDYIKFARARGINEKSINYKHALKNGLIPVITIAGINIGTLIAFSIILKACVNSSLLIVSGGQSVNIEPPPTL